MATDKKSIAVSILKAQLLEVVRQVEKGESFQITKDGKAVAEICPLRAAKPAVGFAHGEILGSLETESGDDFEFDVPNLKPSKLK